MRSRLAKEFSLAKKMRTGPATGAGQPVNVTDNRELVAILFADMVGFAAIRQGLALELRAEMLTLAREALSRQRGQLVNTMGDAFLVKFPTADEAVRFSCRLQETICQRNAGQPHHRRFRLRMGMHLGEVVVQPGGNILGDNVNIAARAEKLSRPGGLCVTEQLWRQLDDPIQRRFDLLGNIPVRHIHQRVCFYHWPGPNANRIARIFHRSRIRFARLGQQAVFGMACVLFVLGALALWPLVESWIFSTPEKLTARGTELLKQHYRRGNIDEAVQCFKKAVKEEPGNHEAHAGLAWGYWLRYVETPEPATLEDAIAHAQVASQTNAASGLSHRVLGLAARKQGELLVASNELFLANQSVSWLDGYSLAWFARVQWQLGHNAEALANLRHAAELAATNSDWAAWAAVGAYAYEQSDLAAAQVAFEAAVALDPNNPVALRDLSPLRVSQGRTAEAESLARRSLELRRSAETLSLLASVLLSMKGPPPPATRGRAADYYREAIRQCPNNYLYRLRLANCVLALPARGEEARREYGQAVRQIGVLLRNPTNQPLVLAHRGCSQAGLGKTNEARADFQLASQIAPDHIPVLQALMQGYLLLHDVDEMKRIQKTLDELRKQP